MAIAGSAPKITMEATANAVEVVTSSTCVPCGIRIGRSSPTTTKAASAHNLAGWPATWAGQTSAAPTAALAAAGASIAAYHRKARGVGSDVLLDASLIVRDAQPALTEAAPAAGAHRLELVRVAG